MGKRQKYWATVMARAIKDTRAASPWPSLLRVACAIGAVMGAALAGYLKTRQFQTSGIWGLLAIVAILLLAFCINMFSVPATLAEEGAAREDALAGKLASYNSPEEDVGICAAVSYVRFGVWDRAPDAAIATEGLDAIERKALKGQIHIWGKQRPTARHTLIPSGYWENQGIDADPMSRGILEMRTTSNGPNAPDRYEDLMVNRAEFEREWPV